MGKLINKMVPVHAYCRNPSNDPELQAAICSRMRAVIQAGRVLKDVQRREQYDNGEAVY